MAKMNPRQPKRQRDEAARHIAAEYETFLLLERLESLLEELEELGISTRQELEAHIAALHAKLDAEEE